MQRAGRVAGRGGDGAAGRRDTRADLRAGRLLQPAPGRGAGREVDTCCLRRWRSGAVRGGGGPAGPPRGRARQGRHGHEPARRRRRRAAGRAGAGEGAARRCGWPGCARTSRRRICRTWSRPRTSWRRSSAACSWRSAEGFTELAHHAANSAAAVRFPRARLAAVRPGLALYGAMPSREVAVARAGARVAPVDAHHGGARHRRRDVRELRRAVARDAPVADRDAAARLRRRVSAPRPGRGGAGRGAARCRSSARSAWTC